MITNRLIIYYLRLFLNYILQKNRNDTNWKNWTPEEYRRALSHPLAEDGYKSDFDAMEWADIFVGVQPFGRSASMELGWAEGQGKKTILLLENGEPELMVKMFDFICLNIDEVVEAIERTEINNAKN